MNFRGLDLSLLVILDALMDEAHVSRAADRLNLSQPAASSALQRCRHLFRDDLLGRGRGTMRLTPRAEALRAPCSLRYWISFASVGFPLLANGSRALC
jgi:DNA-binding transcriptional LysR family regulator